MSKKFYLSIALSFYLNMFNPSLHCAEEVNFMTSQAYSDVLLGLSQKFIDFITHIANGEDTRGDEAFALFAPDCKKTFNGCCVAENRETLVANLLEIYANYGSWKLIPLKIITSSETKSVILWINVESKSFGDNTAIVILHYDLNLLIKEIIEVFSPIQNFP